MAVDLGVGLPDKVLARLLADVGKDINGILDTTRDMVQDTIRDGIRDGVGAAELGDRLEGAAAFDEYRAELIARTETATLFNRASTQSYREFGVTHVTVIDGDGDDECAAANGSTWTLEEAEANPIAHPNCTRDFAPILGDVPEQQEPEPSAASAAWPTPDTTPQGVEDATSAWSGIHYADLREYQMTGQVREGYSLLDDPLHGISEERAAQSVSTLTRLIADGESAPTLYRGLSVSEDVAANFTALNAGDTLDMALTSWSADEAQALRYAEGITSHEARAIVIEGVDVQGFNMTPHSFYPEEKEWITNGRFTVVSVTERGDTLIVRLRQQAVFDAP